MVNFESILNLPLIFGAIIVLAIFLYVILDGFDLGVGILFPFAPSDPCRNRMVNSIAPFWDGNETWLILGGGGLFAAFPLAYAVLLPALYLPVMIMLVALVFRGVAFEFRYKAVRNKRLWDLAFHFGSLVAAFSQGVILGGIIQGVQVTGRHFSGGSFDWLSGFSIMTGVAVVAGYGLLGACWLILKTDATTQAWARKSAKYLLIYVLLFMGLVSIWVPYLDKGIHERWFTMPNFLFLAPIPVIVLGLAIALVVQIRKGAELSPFLLTLGFFAMGFIGLLVSLWPWIVPYHFTFAQAAAAPESQSLMLMAVIIIFPVILIYTGYCYYVFRGKATHHDVY